MALESCPVLAQFYTWKGMVTWDLDAAFLAKTLWATDIKAPYI